MLCPCGQELKNKTCPCGQELKTKKKVPTWRGTECPPACRPRCQRPWPGTGRAPAGCRSAGSKGCMVLSASHVSNTHVYLGHVCWDCNKGFELQNTSGRILSWATSNRRWPFRLSSSAAAIAGRPVQTYASLQYISCGVAEQHSHGAAPGSHPLQPPPSSATPRRMNETKKTHLGVGEVQHLAQVEGEEGVVDERGDRAQHLGCIARRRKGG